MTYQTPQYSPILYRRRFIRAKGVSVSGRIGVEAVNAYDLVVGAGGQILVVAREANAMNGS